MAMLEWDKIGQRLYETGVDRGVLFVQDAEGNYGKGEAWSGLTNVDENPSGAESNPQYADNIKYLDLFSAEEFGATIGCFMYPDGFAACDGSAEVAPGVYIGMQNRKAFGFSYRTRIGNDVVGTDYGYKIHLVWGAKASPSEKQRSTVNESPEAGELSYEITTTPVVLTSINPDTKAVYKPTAYMCINSTKVDAAKLASFEKMLYGDETNESRLPTPDEVIEHFKVAA